MSLRDLFWSKGQPWRGIRSWTVPRLLRLAHCALMSTLRISTTGFHRYHHYKSQPEQGVLFVLWHDMTFMPLHLLRYEGINVMMSTSRAGQIQAAFWRLYGWPTIWGSTKKKEGIAALRATLNLLRQGEVVGFTPDGPKGPRHQAYPGAVYLASNAPAVILPFTVAASRAWRLPTWDKYLIPKPFARVHIHIGPPIHIPPAVSRAQTLEWQRAIEAALGEADRVAHIELARRMGHSPAVAAG